MKVVVCKIWGLFELLVIEMLLDFLLGVGEVVIDVKVVGVNFFDVLII